jgi:aubergine-like protein
VINAALRETVHELVIRFSERFSLDE